MPAIRAATPATAAILFTGAGANAAAAASGAGAIASSSNDHVRTSGSTRLRSAEIVISCAAPARSSAPRRHGQLGGAGTGSGASVGPLAAAEVSGGAFSTVIGAPGPQIRQIGILRADQASRLT